MRFGSRTASPPTRASERNTRGAATPQATAPLPNAKGVGGDYRYSAFAQGWRYNGYVLLGVENGSGLAAKGAKAQTVKTWRLADVPKGKILRFEMRGVSAGKPRRAESNGGFGLSDNAATVIHTQDAHNIIWAFYRPGEKPGGVRPYLQWPGSRYSADTAKVNAKISNTRAKPDDLAIEYDPDKGSIAFLHNQQTIYVFTDPKGVEALSKAPLAIVFRINSDNIQTVEMAGWSLKLIDKESTR